MRCTTEQHEALKRDAWESLTPIGIMPAYTDEPRVLELANCACGSTLAREVPATTDEALSILRREGLL